MGVDLIELDLKDFQLVQLHLSELLKITPFLAQLPLFFPILA